MSRSPKLRLWPGLIVGTLLYAIGFVVVTRLAGAPLHEAVVDAAFAALLWLTAVTAALSWRLRAKNESRQR